MVATVERSTIESGATKGEVIEPGEPMRWFWHRAAQLHGLFVR
jgi:hypothetical protein